MLTKHQLLHLNAIIAEADESKLESSEKKAILAAAKEVESKDYDTYLTNVKQSAQDIIDSGVFPALEKECGIHDFLEEQNG